MSTRIKQWSPKNMGSSNRVLQKTEQTCSIMGEGVTGAMRSILRKKWVRIDAGTVKIRLQDTDPAPEAVHTNHVQMTFRPSLHRVGKNCEIAWNKAACELPTWESAISEESGRHRIYWSHIGRFVGCARNVMKTIDWRPKIQAKTIEVQSRKSRRIRHTWICKEVERQISRWVDGQAGRLVDR